MHSIARGLTERLTEKANSDSEPALEAEIDESDVADWSPNGEKVASGGSSVDGSDSIYFVTTITATITSFVFSKVLQGLFHLWLKTNFCKTTKGHFCKTTKGQMIKLIAYSISGLAYLKLMGNKFGHPKMIKLIAYSISGLAYLKFMGNKFGHPKRVEFPMTSNGFSFSLAKWDCDLLAREGVHQNLLSFDKILFYVGFIVLFLGFDGGLHIVILDLFFLCDRPEDSTVLVSLACGRLSGIASSKG
ncbi:hypothetical protein L1987_23449 [Smallanthus sonchifolius]|uniref:Uncharacterized protein n=1 Tax=Smallanthus sonchifolius TaxID=185202 RepID=A0ACB9IGY9_9ASTR|nr:hypothetical protein L1987_23449 [Smallanthus sonchifolius]